MAAVAAHPLIVILILFVLFFSVFFLLIYGSLRFLDRRKASKNEELEQNTVPVQSSYKPSDSQIKSCPKCGTNMPRFADYCPECGTPQISAR